jgi:hypothetical protein
LEPIEARTPAVGLGGQGEEVGDNGLAPQPLLGIFNAYREIHKHTDTDVAFTQEYSRVSISTGNVKCTRESRPSKDKDKRRKIYIYFGEKRGTL